MSVLTDITLPVYNNMWSYRPEWKNTITEIESVFSGGKSTVYNFNLHSHTGTYIETCEHKIKIEKKLNSLPLSRFYGPVHVIYTPVDASNSLSLKNFLNTLNTLNREIHKNDKVIIFSGYSVNHSRADYLENAPHFEKDLTDYLIEKELDLLGVDSPIIENRTQPYQPINSLFQANPDLLILAPLLLKPAFESGHYQLSCFPLPIENISGSLCRAILIK